MIGRESAMRWMVVVFLFLISGFAAGLAENERTSDLTTGARIIQAARSSLGKEMWHGYGLKNGYLGCAAAVSNVLKKAGVSYVSTAGVVIMRSQLLHGSMRCREIILKDGGTEPINDKVVLIRSQPGDILVAFVDPPSKPNTGGNAHCGIMSDGLNTCTNDWDDGIWKSVNVHLMFDQYRYVRLLRLF